MSVYNSSNKVTISRNIQVQTNKLDYIVYFYAKYTYKKCVKRKKNFAVTNKNASNTLVGTVYNHMPFFFLFPSFLLVNDRSSSLYMCAPIT